MNSFQSAVQRSMISMLPRRYNGPRLVFKPSNSFGRFDEIAIHLLQPSDFQFFDALETAERDGFETIVIYL